MMIGPFELCSPPIHESGCKTYRVRDRRLQASRAQCCVRMSMKRVSATRIDLLNYLRRKVN